MRSITLILFLLWLMSCELVTEIDIPEDPVKAVVNCIFMPDSTWMITVGATTPIQSSIQQTIQNPQATLTDENGVQIPLIMEDRPYNPFDPFFIGGVAFTSTGRPIPGMKYSILVSGTNIQNARATAITPISVGVIDAKLDSANKIVGTEDNWLAIPIEFTFDDPQGPGDFYYPFVMAYGQVSYTDPITGEVRIYKSALRYPLAKSPPTQGLFDDNRDITVIPDKTFDGERHTPKLFIMSYYQPGGYEQEFDSVVFYLSHTKEEYFKYFQTTRLYDESRGNPFATPVQVYSNVEDGLGIFAGSTPSHWNFK